MTSGAIYCGEALFRFGELGLTNPVRDQHGLVGQVVDRLGLEQDISGMDIAVDQAALVGELDRQAQLLDQ